MRIDIQTHEELKRLSDRLGVTVGQTVTLAVRALRQERIGADVCGSLSSAEMAWLDAELG